jgi:hypothetical protein
MFIKLKKNEKNYKKIKIEKGYGVGSWGKCLGA